MSTHTPIEQKARAFLNLFKKLSLTGFFPDFGVIFFLFGLLILF